MKAVVAAFNQEKAQVGAFSVIMNLQMELFEALVDIASDWSWRGPHHHAPSSYSSNINVHIFV